MTAKMAGGVARISDRVCEKPRLNSRMRGRKKESEASIQATRGPPHTAMSRMEGQIISCMCSVW